MKKVLFLTIIMVIALSVSAQDNKAEEKKPATGYKFTVVKELPHTAVKNQSRSGTCWSFSGLSFIESELLRLGKGEYDLSVMFVSRNNYEKKADKYVRMHGKINFAGGGSFQDVIETMSNTGIVPEEVYNGINYGGSIHDHSELDAVTKAYMDAVIKGRKLTKAWKKGFEGILNAYYGNYPEQFTYNGKSYTPESFAQSLGLNFDDYVNLTSFTHHPFYKPFVIEVPDNYIWGINYNIPIDELVEIIDNSIEQGYTVAWSSDVSERGFQYRKGIAVVPDLEANSNSGTDRERWETLSRTEREAEILLFDKPVTELKITQELRQEAFDNYETTDDHGMHIIGIAKDQNGAKFYKVKNSWGTDGSEYSGFFYVSENYVRYKTMNVLIHKNVIPTGIKSKLGL
ncbi:MAG: C1 family peptidase [Prevotellaceae bacterium]|jgi:aminopeptidase C|nr:C1 family peptidase [Prevotellaceae bacterium]